MTDLVPMDSTPTGWRRRCNEQHLFFASDGWLQLLEQAFGARTTIFWDDTQESGAPVTLFRAGPFRVGYLGFPIGTVVGDPGNESEVAQIRAALRTRGVAALRIAISAFGPGIDIDAAAIETPETAIADLPSWSDAVMSENQRRNLKKARQSGLQLVAADDSRHAAALHAIYSDTLQRHRGQQRYNREYFEGLVQLAQHHDGLRIRVALAGSDVAGFLVAVRNGDSAFYLHGGMHQKFSAQRPSALLMRDAIDWARDLGCRRFNLMSSPPDQASLVRFKEGWGGETRRHRTCTLGVGAGYWPFRIAERIYTALR